MFEDLIGQINLREYTFREKKISHFRAAGKQIISIHDTGTSVCNNDEKDFFKRDVLFYYSFFIIPSAEKTENK